MSKCKRGHEIKVVRSAAGYYRGTADEQGYPNCRLTTRYAKTQADAEHLPLDRQTAMENRFCNGCGVCFE